MKVQVTAKVEKGRVVLWERDRAHPDGEVYIVGGREGVFEVGDTSAVQRRIKDGLLVEVVAPKKAPKLTDISGIGKATAEKLAAAGVKSVGDLAALSAADADSLSGPAGVSAEQLLEWQAAAKKLSDEAAKD